MTIQTLPKMFPLILSDGTVELLKWLALILMTADHAQKYGMTHEVPWIYSAARVSMPLFGIVLAYNLARRSSDPSIARRVFLRLLVFGSLATVPFIALGGLGFGWWPLNVMLMLAVAVAIMHIWEMRRPYWRLKATALFLIGGAVVEFWWPGIAICVSAWRYIKAPSWSMLFMWIAATASLTLINGNWWAMASFGLLSVVSFFSLQLPRVPWFFYAYYPVHLLLLLLFGSHAVT